MIGNVHLTPQLVQAVRDAVDIVDVAGDHTRLQKNGTRWKGLCPLHKEKTPSFSVDPGQGLYYCFGCGRGGDAIGLYMELSGDDFPTAIESLARLYGIPLPTRPSRGAGSRRDEGPDLGAVLTAAATFFRAQLARHPEAQRYLERRKIPSELVEAYALGYAPDGWQNLYEAMRFDHPVAALVAAGLVGVSEKSGRHYDRFRHRLIFPIRNPAGRIVGFGGRTLGDDKAKYVNTSETTEFHKGSLLYGLDVAKKAIRETGKALLVEGYFDVLGAVAAGIPWTVAGMGTSLTEPQARLLGRFADEVVLGYDGDEAGETACRRSLPILFARGIAVKRARFGEGHDPDSLRLAAGPEAVGAAVAGAVDAAMEEIERLVPAGPASDPHAQAAAAKAVTALLAPMPDAVLRFAYARRAADRLGIPAEMLSRRLAAPGSRGEGAGGSRGEGRGSAAASSPPAPADAGTESRPRTSGEVASLEDEVLAVLLEPEATVPPADSLPAPEVFFDPVARNIYRAFHALYRRDGESPTPRAVVDELGADREAVSRVARYRSEAEYPAGCRRRGLTECLDRLIRRWRRERQRVLVAEIRDAQRQGDEPRLARLLDEKETLSRTVHLGTTGAAER